LLSITYLVHTAVANLFLDLPSLSRESWGGRERLGGFLVFKLLLVSAVLAPDTLDLLILLSWYTLLSFLRSLAGLAAATTSHTSQSGQPPRPGVFNLLVLILISDIVSASVCVALFHGAGWSMVLLLTCDCALLAFDAISHILRHCIQTLDLSHSEQISELEATQVSMHSRVREHQQRAKMQAENISNAETDDQNDSDRPAKNEKDVILGEAELLETSRRLDQRMEMMESLHNRRLNILETTVFGLQIVAYFLTVVHFLHIWSLHGLQFTLIDGVLALHLHSAISGACKKISERRNLNRIARDLDITFEDATEIELSKSADNICCICLGTMTTGSVKKVGCGHLYHTHCLREIVERARCMEAAKCPLCRSSVLTGEPPDAPSSDDNGIGINNVLGGGEHALFRFSTEGILPAWLPMPSVSFEVVRRPPMENVVIAPNPINSAANQITTIARNAEPVNPVPPPTPSVLGDSPSFFRRLLRIAGLFPMSAEEEASALEQLVDMFPQYDRADLLRELRLRGVAEGVVESILLGVFQGTQRGPVEEQRDSGSDFVEPNSQLTAEHIITTD
jgi:Ring finger domain